MVSTRTSSWTLHSVSAPRFRYASGSGAVNNSICSTFSAATATISYCWYHWQRRKIVRRRSGIRSSLNIASYYIRPAQDVPRGRPPCYQYLASFFSNLFSGGRHLELETTTCTSFQDVDVGLVIDARLDPWALENPGALENTLCNASCLGQAFKEGVPVVQLVL
ncbi:hypothetical protein C8R45DRAFT_4723 [Mycena sanguinolenta]|nr:hypothetical protein C8R45DRAFT_4723 [Mycena sanguinolenta]